MNHPKISIVVPCRNERDHIETAILSILSQTNITEQFEIIVADGQSDDGTQDILKKLAANDSRIRIINNPRRIVSTGLNQAIRIAKGDIIIRMDTHSVYADNYVSSCIEALFLTGAQNVGGPARTLAHDYVQQAISIAYHSPFAVGGALFHNIEYEGFVDTVTYGCWHKSTLFELGLFDEELVRNQDDEMNYRLIRSGGKIWQTPKIRSWYFPRKTISKLFQQYMQYGYWKVRVIQKHRIPAALRHLAPGAFIFLILGSLLLMPFSYIATLCLTTALGLYLIANFIATVVCCANKNRLIYIPIMPIVFAAYHFGYGWGFLRGVMNFYIFRRKQDLTQYSDLTR